MADQKLTALTEATALATTDILYAVINPGTTPASRKINISNAVNSALVATTRITSGPYALLATDKHLFVDTDGGAVTVTLPVGTNGKFYSIKNCGSNGNNITLTPNGAELLFGANTSEILLNGEVIDIVYETTEGWR